MASLQIIQAVSGSLYSLLRRQYLIQTTRYLKPKRLPETQKAT
ncbi:hypothetical protein ACF3NW_04480 [Eikenella halliae]